MPKKSSKKRFGQSGQASRVIIILAIILLLAGVLVYFGIKFATKDKQDGQTTETTQTTDENGELVEPVKEPPKPVYEAQMGDIKISMVGAYDMGNRLVLNNFQHGATTEKFIMVTIEAQNKGKTDIGQGQWGMGNMIDSQERVYNQIGASANPFIPQPDLCGALLKPEFTPSRCTRIFEVARVSGGLKVQINGPQKKGDGPVYLDLGI
ncbi:MAG TPA: hypothetical protein VI937_00545 [Negativicutes bacterium]|nr:hypothetical protein [Negativicutes bacterium]